MECIRYKVVCKKTKNHWCKSSWTESIQKKYGMSVGKKKGGFPDGKPPWGLKLQGGRQSGRFFRQSVHSEFINRRCL